MLNMSWFGAVVVPVKLEKHENADSLSLVRLKEPMDVTVVVNTNDWVDKQKAVFCMVDSILPAKPVILVKYSLDMDLRMG
jgi:hypothetical protein